MTVFSTPTLGHLAAPICLVNSIRCPTQALMVVTYPTFSVRVKGRNLGRLVHLLIQHRLMQVLAVDELSHKFEPKDAFVDDIEVVESK